MTQPPRPPQAPDVFKGASRTSNDPQQTCRAVPTLSQRGAGFVDALGGLCVQGCLLVATCVIQYDDIISARAQAIDVSGIRRVFELGATLDNPINFSIGQPDFPVPEPLKEAAINAIRADRNGYTLTQGAQELRDAITARLQDDLSWPAPSDELGLLVTSGTSGALLLAFLAILDPGDEVIIPDPYFVVYPALATLAGATIKHCDT